MRRCPDRRGTTLVELTVASGVLLVMVLMTTTAVVSYVRAYHQYTDKGLRVRQAAKVLEVVTEHLRSAESLPRFEGALSCAQKPLIFSECNAGLSSLYLNSTGVLQLQSLEPDLKVKSSETIGKCQGLTATLVQMGRNRGLHLTIQVEDAPPIETDISLRGVAQ